jgi:hypothetical protein
LAKSQFHPFFLAKSQFHPAFHVKKTVPRCAQVLSAGRTSKMFRVTWRDMSRTLTNEEVNTKHEKVLERSLADGEIISK